VIAIHQFVPTVTRRDAIGHHVLELRAVIRSLGVASDIFAVEIHSNLDHEVRPYQEYVGGGGPTALLYHAATTSVLAEFLVRRPEPKIVDYHNITPARFFTGWDPGHAVAVRDARIEIAAIVRTADLVFTHSRFSARDIEGWGCAHPIVAPVLGASFLDPAVDAPAPMPRRAGLGDRSAVWLFVGRLAPNKAQQQLIKALAIFRRTYGLPAELHLVGAATPPAYRDALVRLATAAGVGDAVHFHEEVSADDLATMYRTADVFVSASAHEGFCVPVVEAMRFGLPVVARAAGAVPETAGGAAVLVAGESASTLAVAVHRVLADPALAARLAAAGRARAATVLAQEHDDYRDALRALVEKMT
jgi:glycosyltransferase involved in cell wall biosynthesis